MARRIISWFLGVNFIIISLIVFLSPFWDSNNEAQVSLYDYFVAFIIFIIGVFLICLDLYIAKRKRGNKLISYSDKRAKK